MSRKPKLKDVGGKPVLVVQEPAPSVVRSSDMFVGGWFVNPYLLRQERYDVSRAVQRCWIRGAGMHFGENVPDEKRGWHGGRAISDEDRKHIFDTEEEAWEVAANRFEAWVAERRELIRNRGVRK